MPAARLRALCVMCFVVAVATAAGVETWAGANPAGPPPLPHRGTTPDRVTVERITLPLTAVSEHPDGSKQHNIGTGFVVGRQLFTAQHTLQGNGPTTIYLDGTPLAPSYTDAETDIAIFDLTGKLCDRHCNDLTFRAARDVTETRAVAWLRTVGDTSTWYQARVLNYAALGGPTRAPHPESATDCAANLIVEVDRPFMPGSSGGPVIDTKSGRIVGIIQGSLERAGVTTGYFKPIACVLPAAAGTRSQPDLSRRS